MRCLHRLSEIFQAVMKLADVNKVAFQILAVDATELTHVVSSINIPCLIYQQVKPVVASSRSEDEYDLVACRPVETSAETHG